MGVHVRAAEGAAPEGATALSRVVLGILVGIVALVGIAPIALAVGLAFIMALAIGAALVLERTNAVEAVRYDASYAIGIAAVVSFALFVILARFSKRDARSHTERALGALADRPFRWGAILLVVVTALVVRLAWDTQSPSLSIAAAAVVLVALYAFGSAVPVLAVVGATWFALGVYRWSVTTRFRAGFATALLAAIVLALAGAHATASPSVPSTRPSLPDKSPTELGLAALRRLRGSSSGPGSASNDVPVAGDNALFQSCMLTLVHEELQVRAMLRGRHKLSDDDVVDLVRDAMLKVCVRHQEVPYPNLGGALTTAAHRRAIDWKRRARTECGIDSEVPACVVTPGEPLLARELAVIDQAYCRESHLTREVIYRRIYEEQEFAEIDRDLKISPNQSKDAFHNGIRRMGKAYAHACRP